MRGDGVDLAPTRPLGQLRVNVAPALGPVSNAHAVAGHQTHKARQEAFIACYREHHREVFRQGLRFGGGRRDFAEDLTQEVFIRLMARWDKLQDKHDVGGWLYRVTANLAVSRLRRERPRNGEALFLPLRRLP